VLPVNIEIIYLASMPAKPRSVRDLMHQQETLASLTSQARRQQQLLTQIREELPDPLGSHCLGAVLNGGTLKLLVDSPVWHAKLRFLTPQLLSTLRTNFPGLANIRVAVTRPHEFKSKQPRKRRPHHSRQGASIVRQGSGDVSDPALGQALKRLARALDTK